MFSRFSLDFFFQFDFPTPFSHGSCVMPQKNSPTNHEILCDPNSFMDNDKNEIPDSCSILITCDTGYAFANSQQKYMRLKCVKGKWDNPIGICESMCFHKCFFI